MSRSRRVWFYTLVAVDVLAFHLPGVWLFFFLLFPRQSTTGGGLADAAFNALLVFAWGFIHSLMARPFWTRMVARRVGQDLTKLVFTIIAGITQCVMLYAWRPLSGTLWRAEGTLYWMLTFLFICTFGLVFYCSVLLDYMEVLGVRGILRRMRGEPPKPPRLCLNGPYLYCRHPVYLASLASLWIGPVMTCGRLEFALLVSLYVVVGTWLEERDIRTALGEAYDRYMAQVPMWIPRFTKWQG
ncbi:MAG: hypothetical protein AB1640_19130 [bacterium]